MAYRYKFLFVLLIFGYVAGVLESNGQIRINEFMASNANVLYDDDYYNFPDWVELYNAGDTEISGYYYLSDDPNNLEMWGRHFSLEAGEYHLVYCDGESGHDHAPFGLDNDGETLYLSSSDGEIVDTVTFGTQYTDISYGYSASTKKWHYCAQPTPNAVNTLSEGTKRAFKPYFIKPPGQYTSAQQVDIYSGLDNADIHYSIDGSVPGKGNDQFNNTLDINSSTVLKTKSYADGWLPSETVANTYLINEPSCTLPILSISTNPDYLWDNQIGIYVEGTNGITENCSDGPRNWNQNWERSAYIEYFDDQGQIQISQPGGIKVSGGCSRQNDLKTLSIYARGKYGDNDFDYPFFKSKPKQEEYRSLFLRNSGNDWGYTMMRDAAIQHMAIGAMDIDYQAYQPVRVYMNGDFWGLMNIREKLDEEYFFHNYGLNDDQIDFLEWENKVIRGSYEGYNAMLEMADQQDLSDQSNYEAIVEQIDIEEYINYMSLHIYVANTDWPGNNIKFWRPHGGKWRWIVYDTDFGFSLYNDLSNHETLHFATEENGPDWPNPPWSTQLFRNLLENESFRNQFAQSLITHMNTTFHPDKFNFIVDSLADMISDEIVLFKQEYGGSYQDWEWQVERLKSASQARFNFMPDYIASFFGLENKIPLTVRNDNKSKGNVKVNQAIVTHSPLTMMSYQGLPYTIEALPASGYAFDHWITTGTLSSTTYINKGDVWNYYDNGDDYPMNWNVLGFDDSSWDSDSAQLGYGDGDETTILSYGEDENNKYTTYLFRKTFGGIDTSGLQNIEMQLLVDDGAIVYLNGQEILRVNMPEGPVDFNTWASSPIANENSFTTYELDKELFDNNSHTIAVEVHQVSGTSSDISLDMELTGHYYEDVEEQVYSTSRKLEGEMQEAIAIEPVFKEASPIEGLVINEIAIASQYFLDNQGLRSDFIEIYNTTDEAIDLGGMYLTDRADNPGMFMVPDDVPELTTIPAKDFLVLFADGNESRGPLHTNFSLDNNGEYIGLSQKIGENYQVLDAFTYQFLETNFSYGRYPDGADSWHHMPMITGGMPNSLDEPAITETIEQEMERVIEMYPNPVRDKLNIRIGDSQEYADGQIYLEIYNIQGKQVYPRVWVNNPELSFSMDNLSNGMYVVRIYDEHYSWSVTRKMVIMK